MQNNKKVIYFSKIKKETIFVHLVNGDENCVVNTELKSYYIYLMFEFIEFRKKYFFIS